MRSKTLSGIISLGLAQSDKIYNIIKLHGINY